MAKSSLLNSSITKQSSNIESLKYLYVKKEQQPGDLKKEVFHLSCVPKHAFKIPLIA